MIWKFIIVFLTSSVKFLFAPVASLQMGFSIWQTLLITTMGGCTGVMVFYFLSTGLQQGAFKRNQQLIAEGKRQAKRKFTRINKAIVNIKRKMGLPGIAFLTLPFVSIPVCAIISAKFFRHRRDTLPMLIASVVTWSLILTFGFSLIP